MAAKKSIAKKLHPSAKRATRQMDIQKRSRIAIQKPERSPEPPGAPSPASRLTADPSLAQRVQRERAQLFKALSVVECCRFATASLLKVADPEYMLPAFEAICDVLNASLEELEDIASECEIR